MNAFNLSKKAVIVTLGSRSWSIHFYIEGAMRTIAAFLSPSINDSIILTHWLRTLEGVGRDWWRRGEIIWSEIESESFLTGCVIVSWLLRRSFQFCFGCKLKKWYYHGMGWWCNRRLINFQGCHFPWFLPDPIEESIYFHTISLLFLEKLKFFVSVFFSKVIMSNSLPR